MIAVLGASSRIGSEVVRHLAQRGVRVRALSRKAESAKPEGNPWEPLIEHRVADAENPAGLKTALEGVDQLFFVMTNSLNQVELELTVVHMANLAGVKHLVKLSAPEFTPHSPVTIAAWHGKIEQVLRLGPIKTTILRPYAFMQNLLNQASVIQKRNRFFGIMGQSVCNWVDVRDIADVAATVLLDSAWQGGTYTLTGGRVYSYPEIAEKISVLRGKPVRYVNQKPERYYKDLVRWVHLPEHIAHHLVEIQQLSINVPETPTRNVEEILGRSPRTLDAFLEENRHAF